MRDTGASAQDAVAPPATAAAAESAGRQVHAMSFDVEEHFQVSAMAGVVDPADWPRHESRVEGNVDRLLALLDRRRRRATFFTLVWVAQRHPEMIRRIVAQGHELASHGCRHDRVHSLTPGQFRADVRDSKAILEDLGGVPVGGYRAPSFSIGPRTPWAHQILAEEGYRYSSSVYPIRHDHYGDPDASRTPYAPVAGSADFLEIPISTVDFAGRRLPCGGGGYFRLLPYALSTGLFERSTAQTGGPGVFYLHPWEIDPGQPRVPGLPTRARVRHYVNLSRSWPRLDRLLRRFAWERMDMSFRMTEGGRP
jgi:polysaccharide deacetylase family protein (PEP-CTERM system associated)